MAMHASGVLKCKQAREAAEEDIEAMTPDGMAAAGLTADYTAACLDVDHRFDRTSVGPLP